MKNVKSISDPKLLRLGEHIYHIPKAPPDKYILYANEKKENQYWRRIEVPELFLKYKSGVTIEFSDKTKWSNNGNYVETISYDDTMMLLDWREQDLKRRWEGVWFMNYGEPTYLTGGQYFQLQWGAMPGYINPYTGFNYGEYREFQRDVHYILDLAKKDNDCAGVFFGKAKKTGVTNLLAIDYCDESTRYREKFFGMMSKSDKDCKDTGFHYYLYCYDKMPDILRPPSANRTQSELILGMPNVKNTGTKHAAKKLADREEGLDNHTFVSSTRADGFDGQKMFRAWVDEYTKLSDPYPDEMNKKSRETVKLGYRIVGKLWYSGYTPEDDGKPFSESRDVWYNSSLETKNGGDRTITTMYNYFIPADVSYENDADGFSFDRYGKNDRIKAKKLITEARKQKEANPSDLQAYIRQYPLIEHEMWQIGGAGNARFDNIRLGKQLMAIKEHQKTGQLLYEMGNFVWKDKDYRLKRGYGEGIFGEVEWMPLTREQISAGQTAPFWWNGRQYMDTQSFNQPVLKNLKDKKGNYRPSEVSPYCAGVDPTEMVEESMVAEGSMDAICISVLPDNKLNSEIGINVSNRPMVIYLHRHDNPDDFYEDLVKAILFFGMPVYVEGNKKWLITKLIADKLHNFMAMRSKEKILEMWDGSGTQTTLDTLRSGSVDVVNDMILSIKRYLKAPETYVDYDNMKLMWHVALIEQLMRFNPKNTKKDDLAMAFGFCELLKEALLGWRIRSERNKGLGSASAQKLFKGFIGKDVPVTEESNKNGWGAR